MNSIMEAFCKQYWVLIVLSSSASLLTDYPIHLALYYINNDNKPMHIISPASVSIHGKGFLLPTKFRLFIAERLTSYPQEETNSIRGNCY